MKLLVALALMGGANAFMRIPNAAPPRVARKLTTNDAARASVMAGNWKMNPETVDEAVTLAKAVVEASKTAPGEFAVFVPFPYLGPVAAVLKGTTVVLGAQDCYTKAKGAFTGATSMGMIKSSGCEYVLAGHSERRTVFGEDDTVIAAKVRTILDSGLKCILCVGESKEEYDLGLSKETCAVMLAKCLKGVTAAELARVVIAYEPVWAIGTGLTATPAIAEDVHKYIRSWFTRAYGGEAAAAMRIQYGGSVTPETVDELMSQPDIDGALVGGASLDGTKFSRIMNYKVA
jgi:triosephosphate isomerase